MAKYGSHFQKSALSDKSTNFDGVSWQGANIEGMKNETGASLPGENDLLLSTNQPQTSNIFKSIATWFAHFNVRGNSSQKPEDISLNVKSNEVVSNISQSETISYNMPSSNTSTNKFQDKIITASTSEISR